MTVASRSIGVALALAAALFALLVVSVGTGEIAIPPDEVVATLFGGGDRATSFVIETLRLPRALTGALIGIALGAGGAIFQSVTRNPLGSPDIVGFIQGAAAAAVLADRRIRRRHVRDRRRRGRGRRRDGGCSSTRSPTRGGVSGYRLVLIGIGVSFMLIAVTDYLLTRSTLEQAQSAQIWLTGSLNGRGWEHVRPIAVALAVLLPLTALLIRPLRMLELGDDTARALGVAVERSRLALVFVAVGLCAVATASAGPIVFVALGRPADRAPADPRDRPRRRLRRADGRRARPGAEPHGGWIRDSLKAHFCAFAGDAVRARRGDGGRVARHQGEISEAAIQEHRGATLVTYGVDG